MTILHIDELSLFKSSSVEVYPTLALCQEFKNFSIGSVKQAIANGFLSSALVQLDYFVFKFAWVKANGFIYKDQHYELEIDFFIYDAPVRAYLKEIVGDNRKHACEKCAITGCCKNNSFSGLQTKFFTNC